MKSLFLLLLSLLAITAHGGPRTSASYRVLTDGTYTGGSRATSTAYTNDGSSGGIAGISTVATPGETMKHGYIGQFTEVTALQLAATPATVNEGTTRQLSASLLNDDLTTTALPATAVGWGVQSGPLTGVDANGLATAAVVYQNTAASVLGNYFSFTATGALTVLNVNTDDLPGYSGDGLDDAWQAQYFGLNNPLAAPEVITDGTGLTNLFKFTAGLIPNNSGSRFFFNPQPSPGVPGQMRLVINPRFADRTYTVITSPALGAGAAWTPLTTFTIDDNGNTRTITDTSATGTRKFYRVKVTKP
ncbi:hypothetical protein [Prosthecobacter sp.]|uniref:hypothetical protein n=1 Tax=Prosthecobacter sp. TaxID=1965333 RepID=UPI0037832A92